MARHVVVDGAPRVRSKVLFDMQNERYLILIRGCQDRKRLREDRTHSHAVGPPFPGTQNLESNYGLTRRLSERVM